ncbi:MAG: hypothetical protein Q7W05_02485 [Deltaproteobacteria bacterium]|nr:hypothetical protein [Deltaproteobacteria bacterium]
MELFTYALLKPMIPFLTLFTLVAAGWALSDLAARRLTGNERTIWAFAILIFPPLGSLLYDLMAKKNNPVTAPDTELG